MFKKSFAGVSIYVLAFWFLVIFAILSMFNFVRLNPYRADIKNFESTLEDVSINFSFKDKIKLNNSFFVCFNERCKTPDSDYFYNVYFSKYTPYSFDSFYEDKLDKIYFVFNDKKIEKELKDIYLYVGNREYYYNTDSISKFRKNKISFQSDETHEKQTYNALILPNDYKNNVKGYLNLFVTTFLSFFYNWQYFIIQYFWLFVAFLIYVFKKDEFNFKLNTKAYWILFGAVILFTILSRVNLLKYYPFWYDEIYTKQLIQKGFISCFKDSGNPPLFFILEFLISKISLSDVSLRLIPLALGIAFVPVTYILFNKINKSIALFASFFISINTIFIYHSKEIRSSILCALLIALSIYFLFKYLNKPNDKNLIYYAICAICAINTHYYLCIFAFCNYIWGIVDLCSRKNKKETVKFTIANLICALTFTPYLIISFKTAVGESFNGWIGNFDKLKFLYTINEYFINKYVFLFLALIVLLNLIFLYLPKNILEKINLKTDPKKENLYIYLVYSITLILIIVSLISVFVKPVFHKRLLLSIYCLVAYLEILSISTVFNFEKTGKIPSVIKTIYGIILFLICMKMTHPMPLVQTYNVQSYMNFIAQDAPKYINKGYEIQGFVVDFKDYINNFDAVKDLNINWNIIRGNKGEYLTVINKKKYVKSGKKTVLYLSSMGIDIENALSFKPNAFIYHTPSIINAKIIYED